MAASGRSIIESPREKHIDLLYRAANRDATGLPVAAGPIRAALERQLRHHHVNDMSTDIASPAPIFRIYRRDDQTFAIEVKIEEMQPTNVMGFATEAAAEAWIVGYQRRMKEIAETPKGRRMRPASRMASSGGG
jgi:hypothetical protein